jgi:hypothetical protein
VIADRSRLTLNEEEVDIGHESAIRNYSIHPEQVADIGLKFAARTHLIRLEE